MGRQWTEEDYVRTTRQIQEWIAQAHRMWASAHQSIQRVKQVQDKLNEHSRTLGCVKRVAPWVDDSP